MNHCGVQGLLVWYILPDPPGPAKKRPPLKKQITDADIQLRLDALKSKYTDKIFLDGNCFACKYSKTPIYGALTYHKPRFTAATFFPLIGLYKLIVNPD